VAITFGDDLRSSALIHVWNYMKSINIATAFEAETHHGDVALLTSAVQSSSAVIVLQVNIGAVVKDPPRVVDAALVAS